MTHCAHTPIPLDFMSETRFMTEKSSTLVTNRPQALTVSPVSVGGQCLRDLRDHLVASSPPTHVTVALWTLNRSYTLAAMIFPSPHLTPPVLFVSIHTVRTTLCTVSIDLGRLLVLYGASLGTMWPFTGILRTSLGDLPPPFPPIPGILRKPCREDPPGRPPVHGDPDWTGTTTPLILEEIHGLPPGV